MASKHPYEPERADDRRRGLVIELVEHRRQPRDVLDDLAPFGWDCERPLALVAWEDIDRVLSRYLDDSLGSLDVELWADAIEVREDLAFESDEVREAVHALANPILDGPLDHAKARSVMDRD